MRELMRADISTLGQGIRNASDAISLIQTADGALSVIDEKLIRMKELASQAATGTYSSAQRLIIDSEYQAMINEITRIANSADFNGIHLLNGNLSGENSAHGCSGLNSSGPLKVHFGTTNDSAEDYYFISIGTATASALGLARGGGQATEYSSTEMAAFALSLRSTYPTYTVGPSSSTFSGLYADEQAAYEATGKTFNASSAIGYIYTSDSSELLSVAQATDGSVWYLRYSDTSSSVIGSATHLATNSGQSISTQELAQQALETIQNAIVSKDTIRANLGALQNRLENTMSNLQIQMENLQAAESRISDVDVASEMTKFVRNQILTQSAVAMLSQANSLPRMALQLISG